MYEIEEIKNILRCLLASVPDTITVVDLNRDFKLIEGVDIPFEQFGHDSLLRFLHSISDVLNVNYKSEVTLVKKTLDSYEFVENGYKNSLFRGQENTNRRSKLERLKLKKTHSSVGNFAQNKNISITFRNDPDDACRKLDVIEHKTSKVPQNVKRNLQQLISNFPSGILCTQLLNEYEKRYKHSLHFERLGFTSLIHLCMDLNEIFHCEENSCYDYKLYDKRTYVPITQNSNNVLEIGNQQNVPEIDITKIKPAFSPDWAVHPTPSYVFKLGEELSNDLIENIGETLPIVVSEISDPGRFWFHKNDGKLDELMNEMQNFYRINRGDYAIPEYLLEVGLYCVVSILGEFQRGLIVDLIPHIGGFVEIYFTDYGTLTKIPKDEICYLSKKFGVLPAQAHKAKLAGIRPKNTEFWTKESGIAFKNLVSSKYISAKSISCSENNILSMELSENSNHNVSINDILVKKGYAEYIQTEENSPVVLSGRRTISKLLEARKSRLLAH